MPRQPGAKPVKGGEMHPTATEQAARSRTFAEQKARLAMQSAGETGRTAIGAATQRYSTDVQARTALQATAMRERGATTRAAMQAGAADERNAQLVKDRATDRELSQEMARRSEQFTLRRDRLRDERADALHVGNKRLVGKLDKEIEGHNDNEAMYDMFTTAVNSKVAIAAARQGAQTRTQQAQVEESRDKIKRQMIASEGARDSFEDQTNTAYDTDPAFTRLTRRRDTIGRVAVQQAFPVTVSIVDKLLGKDEIFDDMESSINEQLGKQTNNSVTLRMSTGDLVDAVQEGRIKAGDMVAAITTLKTFEKRIREDLIKIPEPGEADAPKGWTPSVQDTVYDSYQRILSRIDDVLTAMRKFRSHKDPSIQKMYTGAINIYRKSGPADLLSAVKDVAPDDIDEQLRIIDQIIDATDPGIFTGPKAPKYRERVEFFKKNMGELVQMFSTGMEK